MFHVASPEFYVAVQERLRRCDARQQAVGAGEGQHPYGSLGVPVITPDATGEELDAAWSQVPLRHRLATYAVLPMVAAMQFFRGREALPRPEIEIDDLPTPEREAYVDSDHGEHINRVIVGDRDARLLDALSEVHRTRANERIVVGVVYGASHAPAVVHGLLDRHGYRVRTAEWLTVVAG